MFPDRPLVMVLGPDYFTIVSLSTNMHIDIGLWKRGGAINFHNTAPRPKHYVREMCNEVYVKLRSQSPTSYPSSLNPYEKLQIHFLNGYVKSSHCGE